MCRAFESHQAYQFEIPTKRLYKPLGGDFSFPIRRHALNAFYRIFTHFFANMGVNMGVKFNLLINISRFSSKKSPEAEAPGEFAMILNFWE